MLTHPLPFPPFASAKHTQDPAKRWAADGSGTHYYRASYFPWVVADAKQRALKEADAFTLGGKGTARLAVDVDLQFFVATSGYTNQTALPADHPDCQVPPTTQGGVGGGDVGVGVGGDGAVPTLMAIKLEG